MYENEKDSHKVLSFFLYSFGNLVRLCYREKKGGCVE